MQNKNKTVITVVYFFNFIELGIKCVNIYIYYGIYYIKPFFRSPVLLQALTIKRRWTCS